MNTLNQDWRKLEYQKQYNKRQREIPEKLTEIREKNKILARKYYYNNKDHVLQRRRELRKGREEDYLMDLMTNKLIEISIDE